jgi:holo-[acyl-carrier protein] synthase
MIIGIGTDLVEIKRIKAVYKKFTHRFTNKILSPEEVKLTPIKSQTFIHHLAKRFAAKEAIAKAFGTGIGKELSFHDIKILKLDSGAPKVVISKSKYKNYSIHLSLSDEKKYAIAFAIIEKTK